MSRNQSKKKSKSEILKRGTIIGHVAVQIAGKKLKASAKKIFLDKNQVALHDKETRQDLARVMFTGLCRLRGTALKLAQIFCGETGLLPQEYMKEFEKAHYRVQPLSPALMQSVLRREWNSKQRNEFAELSESAFAAASLGQVHSGRLHDGQEVAVKIQYPGMDNALLTDFQLARTFVKKLPQNQLFLNILNEIEPRIRRELNYLEEAQEMEWFQLQDIPSPLNIPKVHHSLCTPRVLVVEKINGLHFDEWMKQTPPIEDRTLVVQGLFQWFFKSLFVWRKIHTDPHPGNFLVDQTSTTVRVYCLDFGSIQQLPNDQVQFYAELWKCALGKPYGELLHFYQQNGADLDLYDTQSVQEFQAQVIQPYIQWLKKALDDPNFNPQNSLDFIEEGHRIFTSQLNNQRIRNLKPDLILVHRTFIGILSLQKILNTPICLKDHFKIADS